MNLADFLRDTAARLPDQAALVFDGQSLTFNEMDREVDSLVRGLRKAGLEPGDRCVLMMPNCLEWPLVHSSG